MNGSPVIAETRSKFSGELLDVSCDEMRYIFESIPKQNQNQQLMECFEKYICYCYCYFYCCIIESLLRYVTLRTRQRQRILQSICSIPSILNRSSSRLIIHSFIQSSIISPKSVFPKCRPSFLNTILFSNHQLIS